MSALRRILLALVPCCLAALAARAEVPAPAQEPGDLWDVTITMTMAGAPSMALPPRTQRVCTPRQWSSPPIGGSQGSQECTTTDFRTTGSTSTWKVSCPGDPPMTGEGTLTRSGSDAYTATTTMNTPQGTMTMNYLGHRVGDCDVAQKRQQMAAIQAQAAAAQQQAADTQRQICVSAVQALSLQTLTMPGTPCTDPAYKAEFCAKLETADGFELVAGRGDTPGAGGLAEVSAYCGKDAAAVRGSLCASAAQSESLDFLLKHCPAEAQAIAQRECAGRSYTSLTGSKYYDFCRSYAQQAAEAQDKKPDSKTDKAKKALKGLFGH